MWDESRKQLEILTRQLKDVPLGDHATWSQVARHTAGAFAAWSNATESVPGDLASAADALAKSAQTKQRPLRLDSRVSSTLASTARVLTCATRGGQGSAAQLAMMKQLAQLAKSVWEMNRAAGAVRAAADLRHNVRGRLDAVHVALKRDLARSGVETNEPVPTEMQDQMARVRAAAPVRQSVSVLPTKLDPPRPRTPVRSDSDRGGFTR